MISDKFSSDTKNDFGEDQSLLCYIQHFVESDFVISSFDCSKLVCFTVGSEFAFTIDQVHAVKGRRPA